MSKNLNDSKNRPKPSSGVRKNRANKNVKRDGRHLPIDKVTRQILGSGHHDFNFSPQQKDDLWAFHEKDRRDRKGRMRRLQMADEKARKKDDRPDIFRVPFLEVCLKNLQDAQILQKLTLAAALAFKTRKYYPFFTLKRTHKLGNRPIQVI